MFKILKINGCQGNHAKTIFLVTTKIGYFCLITHIFFIWYLFAVSYISLESICITLYDDHVGNYFAQELHNHAIKWSDLARNIGNIANFPQNVFSAVS